MRHLLLALPLLLAPAASLADTCEEVHETCLENCHVDYGMEAQRVELGKCVQLCDRRHDDCADLRQEEKRNQFKLADPDAEKRRGDPADVYHYEKGKPTDVTPAPYEDFEEGDKKPKATEPKKPKKKDDGGGEPEVVEKPSKVDKARQNDPTADEPSVKKKDGPTTKKKKDLNGDDWAKE